MRQFFKYTGYTILTIILLLLLYLGSAWALSHVTVKAEANAAHQVPIYVKTNPVHTDLILPVKTDLKDWSQSMLYTNTRTGDTAFNYIAFGWGDKGFFLHTRTWADLKASVALKAAFWMSSTAVHTNYLNKVKEGKNCTKLELSNDQYKRLITFIENSIQTTAAGTPIAITTDPYGDHDAFYEANGTYSLFHTCNT